MEQEIASDFKKRNDSNKSISSSSSSSDGESTVAMPTAPDGGYGWVIVFSAFSTSFISDGIAFSLGIFYTRFLEVFQESKSVTSWIPSLFYGISLMGGPLAGALATKYGCRRMAIYGGVICALGMVISSFANSVGMLCFTLGIISGFGIAIQYVTSVVVIAFYFEKKRALATGLSVCGTGIGTFVFAPVVQLLMEEYDWRGTLLILGGISLNLVVFGALLRPLEFTPEEKYMNNLETFEKISRTISKGSLPDNFTNRSRHVSNSGEIDPESNTDENIALEHLSYSQVQLPTFVKGQTGMLPEELLMETRRNGSNLQQLVQKYHRPRVDCNDYKRDRYEQEKVLAISQDSVFVTDLNDAEHNDSVGNVRSERKRGHLKKVHSGPRNSQQQMLLLKKDSFYRGNLMKLNKRTATSCPELNVGSFDEEDSSDDEDEDICTPKSLRLFKRIKKFVKSMIDLSILYNPFFVLFLLSNFLLFFWIDIPYVFIVDRAMEVGISDFKATFFVSIIGILNTVGQIAYGFLGDTDINLSLLYGISISSCGVTLIFVPFFVEFVPIAFMSGAFGLFISANYVLSTVILVEYLGMDKLTSAYGFTMLMQGIANMIGPPVAGALFDISGDYDNTFFVGGVVMILSGILVTFVPVTRYISKVRRRQQLRAKIKKETEGTEVEMSKLVKTEK